MPAFAIRDVQVATTQPLCLDIPAGSCLTLSGPSGAGKSLLLRALADLDPHPGEVRLGEAIQNATPAPVWRRMVGYLPAETPWWLDRVRDHFSRPPDPVLLSALGFPPDTPDWPIHRLSSGEKQRLGLLRLLSLQPRALLLDEPTANLDPLTTARVEALIADYRQRHEAPVLWVSHDPAQAIRVGDQHAHLAGGTLQMDEDISG